MSSQARKLVVVGDGMVGKTALLNSFVSGTFEQTYVPTIFETSAKDFDVNGRQITLGLWDTGGQEEFDKIRILAYPGAKVILLCYGVNNRTSLDNIMLTWYPEMKLHCPGVPLILVGCKSDTRIGRESVLMPIPPPTAVPGGWEDAFVESEEVKKVRALTGARAHVECSAKTHSNVDVVFEMAAEIVLHEELKKQQASILCCVFKKRRRRRKNMDYY